MPEGVAEQLQNPPMSSSTVVGTRRWGTCPSSSLHPATAVGWPSGWQRGQLRCSFWRWAPACITEGLGPQSGRRGGGGARRTSGSSGSSGSRVGGVGSGGARWTSGSSGSSGMQCGQLGNGCARRTSGGGFDYRLAAPQDSCDGLQRSGVPLLGASLLAPCLMGGWLR